MIPMISVRKSDLALVSLIVITELSRSPSSLHASIAVDVCLYKKVRGLFCSFILAIDESKKWSRLSFVESRTTNDELTN